MAPGESAAPIVRALAGAGHRTVVLDRAQCDLADAADVRRAAADIGEADVLVHAAAALDQATLELVDLATWRRVQAVNVEAALLLAQAFAPGMARRGWGRIVHIVSDTIWQPPSPELLAYVTSKAALVGLTRALAVALGADGITVNAVAPGLTRTPPRRRASTRRRSRRCAAARPCPAGSCPRTWPAPSPSRARTPPRR